MTLSTASSDPADHAAPILVKDRYFKPLLSKEAIAQRLAHLGKRIEADYQNDLPLFIGVLNGSFVFAADLVRYIAIPCHFSFVKYASYQDKMQSSGVVQELIGLNENLSNRRVVVIEDIVDTGNTMVKILAYLREKGVEDVEIAALLVKPTALQHDISVKYVGFEIENQFVVGYGLDYDGYGRNLDSLYVVSDL
ncbi:hypoxanthine phosphoribosyltransferase [Hugenholtzia roseola]|uniref:hypoxanthine phosphoribosyltransferase n=1 Tax=Hugenholtzia roseola TaxID=1002 RepID=UPI00068856EA|nr:hypoxanthine phosphoribosyltransferase [Hugenholtzia roseola]